MQLLTAALPLLLVSSASASWLKSDQKVLDSTPVPGSNPLTFCDNPDDYFVKISSVDLSPNPPQAGNKLIIEATGEVNKDVEEGAHVNVQVKYGLITLINMTEDLCEQVKQVNLTCPLKKGQEVKFTKDVNLPAAIPPGTYTAKADARTADDEVITCLQTTISFNTGLGASSENL